MALEEARAALLAEILDGDAAFQANQESRCENVLDQRALQQIVDSCFVKLHQLRLLHCDACEKVFHNRSRLEAHHFDAHVNKDLKKPNVTTSETIIKVEKAPDLTNIWHTDLKLYKSYKCDICDKVFAFRVNMEMHKLQHSDKHCGICQKIFLHKITLENHVRRCHSTVYNCGVCDKHFQCLEYLKKHSKLHNEIKPYTCEFCEKKFHFKNDMTRHRRTHTGETPYKCVCGRQFSFYTGLKYHRCSSVISTVSTATPEQKLQCDYCNRKYSSRIALVNHIRIHLNTQKYSCNYCTAKFNVPSGLKRHLTTHTGERPFTCSICNSKFGHKYKLKEHMDTHSTEKPHTCDLCGKRFKSKKYVTRHLKVHTKSYECTECGKLFHSKNTLDKHFKHCVFRKSHGKSSKPQRKKKRKTKKNISDSDSS